MKYQDYAFTLRKTSVRKNPATREAYCDHITRIFSANGLETKDYAFELESGLHVHGVVRAFPLIKEQDYKKFRVRGWRVHIVPIYDMKGWHSYYMKNQYVPSEADRDAFNQYKISGSPSLEVKHASTWYPHEETIEEKASGLSERASSHPFPEKEASSHPFPEKEASSIPSQSAFVSLIPPRDLSHSHPFPDGTSSSHPFPETTLITRIRFRVFNKN